MPKLLIRVRLGLGGDEQRLPRAEDLLVRAERDDDEVVLRVAEEGSLRLADADDAEGEPADLDRLVERRHRSKQRFRQVGADDRHRAVTLDLDAAHHAPGAVGVVAREVEVLGADAGDAHALDQLILVGDVAAVLGRHHHRADVGPEPPDGVGFVARRCRVVAMELFFLLGADRRPTLDRERVGADVRHDRRRHHCVHALDQRHHGDDRRHRDDVTEHRHERSELVRPDRLQRDDDRLKDLMHVPAAAR
jgi:hypothetical protein